MFEGPLTGNCMLHCLDTVFILPVLHPSLLQSWKGHRFYQKQISYKTRTAFSRSVQLTSTKICLTS